MSELEEYAGYDKLDVVHTPQFTRRKNANLIKEKQAILNKRSVDNYWKDFRKLSAVKR